MEWWILYLLMGLFVGFFAGMLGVGGGLILVTLMVFLFSLQGFPADRVVHIALGTSLTSIVFTSISSLRAHHRHGAVRWDIVKMATPGLVAGTLLGAFVADRMASKYLAIFFVALVYYSAVQMFADMRPKPTRTLPGLAGMSMAAIITGIVSSLVGAGGVLLSIPLMNMSNVTTAIAGAAGYIYNGLGQDHLPPLTLGYVYVPALVGIVIGTFVTVPAGAKAAHTMPVPRLKKIFAVLLFLMATKMLWTLF